MAKGAGDFVARTPLCYAWFMETETTMPITSRKPTPPMTQDDFVAWMPAWRDPERYELIEGKPVAMAGGKEIHEIVALNLTVALAGRLRPRGCRPYRDLLVCSPVNDGFAAFPDVYVRCAPVQELQTYVTDPVAVFEIVSPTTQFADRGYKLEQYMLMPSIQHIGLIYPREIRIECWSRAAGDLWPREQTILTRLDDTLPLAAFGIAVPLGEIYDGTEAGQAQLSA